MPDAPRQLFNFAQEKQAPSRAGRTSQERPFILVANDDGIEADGLWYLAEALQEVGEVMVVAPAFQQSGMGTAVTIFRNLQSERAHSRLEGVDAWQVDGTPTDAVIVGLHQHTTRHVDMIVSGVNPGPNMGTDVVHSGTVGAAMQGFQRALPSLAVSLASTEGQYLADAATVGARIAGALWASGRPLFLNVNVPARPLAELVETRVTILARRSSERLVEEVDADGVIRRRLEYVRRSDMPEGTDIWAVNKGLVSVTPLHVDLTAFHALDEARQILSP